MPPETKQPDQPRALRRRIQALILFFMAATLLSGLTAFPLALETRILDMLANGPGSPVASYSPALADWLARVAGGLAETDARFPFIAYGTDWLAFAHIVIALAFIGPLRDPVRNIWVIEWGIIACLLVPVLALACGPLRGIPPFWRAIDCSFGLGVVPLWLCRRAIVRLAALPEASRQPDTPSRI